MEAHKVVINNLLKEEKILPKTDYQITDSLLDLFLAEYARVTNTSGKLKQGQTVFAKKLAFRSFLEHKLGQGLKPKEGFLYVIENSAWPGYYKIGMSWTPHKRLSQYQTYSPLRDFKIKHYSYWSDKRAAEKEVHKFLANKLTHEWAKLSEAELANLLQLLNSKGFNI